MSWCGFPYSPVLLHSPTPSKSALEGWRFSAISPFLCESGKACLLQNCRPTCSCAGCISLGRLFSATLLWLNHMRRWWSTSLWRPSYGRGSIFGCFWMTGETKVSHADFYLLLTVGFRFWMFLD